MDQKLDTNQPNTSTPTSCEKEKPDFLVYLSHAIIILGIIGLCTTILCYMGLFESISHSVPLPLLSVSAIAVDSKGNTYCAMAEHARIHKYGPDGKYIRGWRVDSRVSRYSRSLLIEMNTDDQLLIKAGRCDYYIIDPEAGLVAKDCSDTYFSTVAEDRYTDKDERGNSYEMKYPYLLPRLVKTDHSGHSKTLISTPVYLFPFVGEISAALTIVLGAAIIECADALRRKNKI